MRTLNERASSIVARLHQYPKRNIMFLSSFVLLFLTAFRYNTADIHNNIDGSWQYTLSGLRHSSQTLGVDIFFNYGPFFERSVSYVHRLDTPLDFVLGLLLISVLLTGLLYTLGRFLATYLSYLKYFPLVATTLLVLFVYTDMDSLYFIMLIISSLAIIKEERLVPRLTMIAAIQLFSLYKFSFSVPLLAISPLLFLASSKKDHLKRWAGWLALFLGSYYLIYSLLTLSLNPLNILRYWYYGIVNAIYYNEYMSLPFSLNIRLLLIAAFLFCLLLVGCAYYAIELLRNRGAEKSIMSVLTQLAPVVIILVASFMCYKAAITRTDGHIFILLPMVAVWGGMLTALLRVHLPYRYQKRNVILITVCLVFFSFVLSVNYILFPTKPPVTIATDRIAQYFNSTLKQSRYSYTSFVTARDATMQDLASRAPELSNISAGGEHLPPKGSEIIFWGNTTVLGDLLAQKGYEVLYQPFLQNYSAHPPSLFDTLYINQAKNHPSAYVFAEETEGSVNEHLPTFQLNNYFHYVKNNYSVVSSDLERRSFVLKPKPVKSQIYSHCKTISDNASRTGSLVSIPRVELRPDQDLVMRIKTDPSLIEPLVGLLTKYPVYDIIIYNKQAGMMRWRIAKTTLEHGVTIQPLNLNFYDAVKGVDFGLKQFTVNDALLNNVPMKIQFDTCSR